jgi:hypothetical protein
MVTTAISFGGVVTAHQRLECRDDVRCDHHVIDGEVRHRAVASTLPVIVSLKVSLPAMVIALHIGANLADGSAGPDVQGYDPVSLVSIKEPVIGHRLRTDVVLLRRLERKDHRAVQLRGVARQQLSGRYRYRYMRVVAAGVHRIHGRCERQPGALRHWEGVDIGPDHECGAARAAFKHPDNARVADAFFDLKPHRVQTFYDDRRSTTFLKLDLWIGVDVTP